MGDFFVILCTRFLVVGFLGGVGFLTDVGFLTGVRFFTGDFDFLYKGLPYVFTPAIGFLCILEYMADTLVAQPVLVLIHL
jgi:hypothetical protein